MNKKPTVLITGAAGGLGQAVVEKFLNEDWRVAACDIRDIKKNPNAENLLPLRFDVTDMKQIESVKEHIKSTLGEVDVLINAAGILDFYPLSEVPPERLKTIFNVNTFGPVAMIRAFLPLLIKSKGRVINISSESVKFTGAFQPYQPSKIALEALHKTLRQELHLKGVKMVIVRPGAIDTEMTAAVRRIENPVENSLYHREFEVFKSRAREFIDRKISPGKVAELIYKAASVKKPRYYYHINHSMRLALISKLPERLLDRMTAWMFGKKKR